MAKLPDQYEAQEQPPLVQLILSETKELICHTIHRVRPHPKNVLNRATKEHLFTQKILNRKTNNKKLNQKSKTKD